MFFLHLLTHYYLQNKGFNIKPYHHGQLLGGLNELCSIGLANYFINKCSLVKFMLLKVLKNSIWILVVIF